MKKFKFVWAMGLVVLISACKHPLGVVGNGDILSASGTRHCYLEDALAGHKSCTENTIQGDYFETYYAVPRPGWKFAHWEVYCADTSTEDECSFNIPGNVVADFANDEMPALVAVFTPIVQTGGQPKTSDVVVSWTPPTQREDGAPLSSSELSGYEITYAGVNTGTSMVISVGGGNTKSFEINDLPADIYYFHVVAIDTDNLKSKNPEIIEVDLR